MNKITDKIYIEIEKIDNCINILFLNNELSINIIQILEWNNKKYWVSYIQPLYNWECINSNNDKLKKYLESHQYVIDELTTNKADYTINTEIGVIKIIENRIEVL